MCWGCIFETHQYNSPFESAPQSHDHGILDIIWMHSCLDKWVCHIQLAPDFSLSAVSQDIINTGQWVTVCYSIGINLMVVIYPPMKYGSIGFWDHECWWQIRGVWWLDSASVKVFLDEGIPGILVLPWCQITLTGDMWLGIFYWQPVMNSGR